MVAQSVEQQTENLPVGGSIPPQGTKQNGMPVWANILFFDLRQREKRRVIGGSREARERGELWIAERLSSDETLVRSTRYRPYNKMVCPFGQTFCFLICGNARNAVLSVVRVRRENFLPRQRFIKNAGVAQLAEQLICNQQVVGSSPITGSTPTTISYGQIPERPNGSDCKSDVFDFGGSNPPLPTKDV